MQRYWNEVTRQDMVAGLPTPDSFPRDFSKAKKKSSGVLMQSQIIQYGGFVRATLRDVVPQPKKQNADFKPDLSNQLVRLFDSRDLNDYAIKALSYTCLVDFNLQWIPDFSN
jgi:hypothetical protein